MAQMDMPKPTEGADLPGEMPDALAPSTMSEILLETMSERDALKGALQHLVDLKDGPRDDTYRAAKDEAWAHARALLPIPELTPAPATWATRTPGEALTIPAEEVMPYDQLADGRFIRALHGAANGAWTQMEVGEVVAQVELFETFGSEKKLCMWGPQWGDTERVPVPRLVNVFRGGNLPGYRCTSPGNPDECDTCPARRQ